MKCQLKEKCIHIQALWTNMIDCQSQLAAHSIWAFVKDIWPVISDIAEEKQTRPKKKMHPTCEKNFYIIISQKYWKIIKNLKRKENVILMK